jgi:hypothetical protein
LFENIERKPAHSEESAVNSSVQNGLTEEKNESNSSNHTKAVDDNTKIASKNTEVS